MKSFYATETEENSISERRVCINYFINQVVFKEAYNIIHGLIKGNNKIAILFIEFFLS